MENFDWMSLIYNSAPAAAGVVVTLFWFRISKVLIALKEFSDVLTVIVSALEDKELSKEEVAAIKKEIGEAIAAFKGIFK